jgi:omega-6 fatty acid desaturase (delta-12 desaturase)
LLAIPAAGFLVRLFLIQHDCGHGSFLPSRTANDWLGRILGVFTLTPYNYWRLSHANHHATSGNLDRRELGAIEVLTVEEYKALSPMRRFGYRLYRHPLVLFGLGPAFVFFIQQRIPVGMMKAGWGPWISTLGTTVAMVVVFGGIVWLVGNAPILAFAALAMLIASSVGVWLFYVQHQFDGVVWYRKDTWRVQEGALHGSSHYDLPPVLRWMTANIGIHHVHHLSSRIPFYRLGQVMRDFPELANVSKLKLKDSFKCARLALWDEPGQRLVSFREARQMSLQQA